MLVVAAAIVEQIVETFSDAIENPWIGVALGFLSAAAIGVDAWVVGVRRVKGEGPSIRNLAPGGWAMFGAMLWILAVPAYFFARRRVRRGDEDHLEHARATWRDGVAIGVVAAIGALAATGVR